MINIKKIKKWLTPIIICVSINLIWWICFATEQKISWIWIWNINRSRTTINNKKNSTNDITKKTINNKIETLNNLLLSKQSIIKDILPILWYYNIKLWKIDEFKISKLLYNLEKKINKTSKVDRQIKLKFIKEYISLFYLLKSETN